MSNDEHVLKAIWEEVEQRAPMPDSFRGVQTVDYDDLAGAIEKGEEAYLREIVTGLYAGDLLIAKGAFQADFLKGLKGKLMAHAEKVPQSFHKMEEGCPDFHRIIDEAASKKYSVECIRHSFYVFNWNDDPFEVLDDIYPKWRMMKRLMGLSAAEYENNTPKDGIVDRIQIVKYPSGSGYIEPHTHHPKNQKLIINVYMSQADVDYSGGGVYFLDGDSQRINAEGAAETGDIGLFYATVRHGVDPVVAVEPDSQVDPAMLGRWWMGLYSPESDVKPDRVTSSAVGNA